MTKEELIREAIKAYPDIDLIPFDFNTLSYGCILCAARGREFGDMLLSFIICELDNTEENKAGEVDIEDALKLLARAKLDIEAVEGTIRGLL